MHFIVIGIIYIEQHLKTIFRWFGTKRHTGSNTQPQKQLRLANSQ